MKSIFICSLLFLVAACFKVDEKVSTSNISKPDYYMWNRAFPQNIYLADGYDNRTCNNQNSDICENEDVSQSTFITELMASRWNNLYSNITFIELKDVNPPADFKKKYSSIKEVNSDGYSGLYTLSSAEWQAAGFASSTLGVTILLGRTNQQKQYIIQEGDILINNRTSNSYNLGTILLHELGHFLGLQHLEPKDKSSTVMFPRISEGDIKQTPTSLDKQTLAGLYQITGSTGQNSRHREIENGTGSEIRVIFELGADKTCRHLINGELVHSHTIDL